MPYGTRKHFKGLRRASPILTSTQRGRFNPGQPIAKIDMRPAAILLTVLCLFFAMFQKAPVHSMTFDIEHRFLSDYDVEGVDITPVRNQITVTEADTILWNCEAVTRPQLTVLLVESLHLPIEPITVFYAEPDASYNLAALTLQQVWVTGITKFEFAGLEQHRNFDVGTSRQFGATASTMNVSLSLLPPPEQADREWRPSEKATMPYSLCDEADR